MQTEAEITRANLERRLRELRQELATGDAQLTALDMKRRETTETMLRITGAIQVLEELLSEDQQAGAAPVRAGGTAAGNGLQPVEA